MLRRAAIVSGVAAALAALASVSPAGAAWSVAVKPAGFCTPATDDPSYVPRVVTALNVAQTATKPIAILDTGVDPNVPSLSGRVLGGFDATANTPYTGDTDGHGTMVAGLAAAAGSALLGVSSVSPILPVRIYDANRASTAAGLARGIAWAVQQGAGVIAISGSGTLSDTSPGDVLKVQKAIDDAFAAHVLVFAGAGDDSTSNQQIPGGLAHVLVAGSATSGNVKAATSDTGPWLDVLAPAEGITAPLPAPLCNLGYGYGGDTGFAAAIYAAAGALTLAQRPDLTTQQTFELLRRAATDISAKGRDDESGFGILNVASAITSQPQAKEGSAEPDDDMIFVRGAGAKTHPYWLTKTKMRFKTTGTVSPAKDPADVYRVRLIKGERMVVSVNAADPGALLELSILNPRAGDYDITNGVNRNRSVSTGGLSEDPQLEIRASRTGTYYIAIEAADPVDPDDPTATAPDLEAYTISAYKQRKKAKKKR